VYSSKLAVSGVQQAVNVSVVVIDKGERQEYRIVWPKSPAAKAEPGSRTLCTATRNNQMKSALDYYGVTLI